MDPEKQNLSRRRNERSKTIEKSKPVMSEGMVMRGL